MFEYGQEISKYNFRSDCEINFNCIVTQDGHQDTNEMKVEIYDAIVAVGGPGTSRFKSHWDRSSKIRRPEQIWAAIRLVMSCLGFLASRETKSSTFRR